MCIISSIKLNLLKHTEMVLYAISTTLINFPTNNCWQMDYLESCMPELLKWKQQNMWNQTTFKYYSVWNQKCYWGKKASWSPCKIWLTCSNLAGRTDRMVWLKLSKVSQGTERIWSLQALVFWTPDHSQKCWLTRTQLFINLSEEDFFSVSKRSNKSFRTNSCVGFK